MKETSTMKLWLRILAMIMVMTMLFSVLAACSSGDTDTGDDDDDKGNVSDKNDKDDDKDNDDKDDDKPSVDTSKMEADEHWQYVSGETLGGAIKALTNTYGSLMGVVDGNGAQGAKVDVQVELGKSVLEVLSQGMSQSGMDMDLDFLQKIHLAMEVISTGDATELDVLLGLGSKDIATISAILDMAGGKMLLGIPDWNSTYLGVDFTDAGIDTDEMNTAMSALQQMMAAMPSEEVMAKLVDKYLDIALKSFTDVEKNEATLELDGLKQDCTELVVTVRHEDVLNMAINVLTELKDDKDVKKIIEDLAEELGEGNVYESMQEAIEYSLEELEDQLEYPEDGEVILTTYVDDSNAIIGMSLASPENDAEELYFKMVTEGNKWAFELVVFEDFGIFGDGTIKSGKADGQLVLEVDGQEMVNLEISSFDVAKLEKGYLSGTITIASPALDTALMGTSAGLELTISLDTNAKGGTMSIAMNTNAGLLAKLTLSIEATSGGNINIPNNYVDPTNQQELMEWMMDINFNKVVSTLKSAGLPSELTDMLEQLADQLESMQ